MQTSWPSAASPSSLTSSRRRCPPTWTPSSQGTLQGRASICAWRSTSFSASSSRSPRSGATSRAAPAALTVRATWATSCRIFDLACQRRLPPCSDSELPSCPVSPHVVHSIFCLVVGVRSASSSCPKVQLVCSCRCGYLSVPFKRTSLRVLE